MACFSMLRVRIREVSADDTMKMLQYSDFSILLKQKGYVMVNKRIEAERLDCFIVVIGNLKLRRHAGFSIR